ncbi:hypothetical protein GCM10009733_093610 [Nonomuraea maheshkhaliensis]|uniref:Uncharacterized protein n=1 Tax=Nonomuraea maheshkhaliensis TaxID=419590 RepID=A0ABN2H5G4_9ACTN
MIQPITSPKQIAPSTAITGPPSRRAVTATEGVAVLARRKDHRSRSHETPPTRQGRALTSQSRAPPSAGAVTCLPGAALTRREPCAVRLGP